MYPLPIQYPAAKVQFQARQIAGQGCVIIILLLQRSLYNVMKGGHGQVKQNTLQLHDTITAICMGCLNTAAHKHHKIRSCTPHWIKISNMQDRARFSTHFIHKFCMKYIHKHALPFPLFILCEGNMRKCHLLHVTFCMQEISFLVH